MISTMADLVFPGQTPGGTLNQDALPSNTNLVIYKGDYVEVFVTLLDDSENPLNLTGFTAAAQLKKTYADSSPVDFTCSLVNPATSGSVRIYLPTSASSTLEAGSYIWDFEVINSNGDARTYLTGDVIVYDEVTTA